MDLIRILIVDDSTDYIDSASRFLASDPRLQIVGNASTGVEALEKVAELKPDLVLMDWAMPEMTGPVALRRIKAQSNPPRIIMLTMYDNTEYRDIAQMTYADGFVAKSDFGKKLLPLIYSLFETKPAEASVSAAVNEETK